MYQCKNGYEIEEDYGPPLRCHFQGKYDYPNCKFCPDYNHEYDLVNQAIESAKCRIYIRVVHWLIKRKRRTNKN